MTVERGFSTEEEEGSGKDESLEVLRDNFDYGSDTEASLTHPERNEDQVLSLPDRGIFGVFDGVGGYAGGDVASLKIAESVGDFFNNYDEEISLDTLVEALRVANNEVYNFNRDNNSNNTRIGSTASLVKISEGVGGGGEVLVAQVGDSPVFHITQSGEITEAVEDYIFQMVNGANREEKITLDDIKLEFLELNILEKNDLSDEDFSKARKENRNNLSDKAKIYGNFRHMIDTAVGYEEELSRDAIKTTKFSVAEGDWVVIVSDGVSDNLLAREIKEIVMRTSSPQEASEQLVEEAKTRCQENNYLAKKDDITAQVIRINSADDKAESLADTVDLGAPVNSVEKAEEGFDLSSVDEETRAWLEKVERFSADEIKDIFNTSTSAAYFVASRFDLYPGFNENPEVQRQALRDYRLSKIEDGYRALERDVAAIQPLVEDTQAQFVAWRDEAKKEIEELGEEVGMDSAVRLVISESVLEATPSQGADFREVLGRLGASAKATSSLEEEFSAEVVSNHEEESREQKEGFLGSWGERAKGAFFSSMIGVSSLALSIGGKVRDKLQFQKRLELARDWLTKDHLEAVSGRVKLTSTFDMMAEAPASAEDGVEPVDIAMEVAVGEVREDVEGAKKLKKNAVKNLSKIMGRFKEKIESVDIKDVQEAQNILDTELKDLLAKDEAVKVNFKFSEKDSMVIDELSQEIDFMLAVNVQTAMRKKLDEISSEVEGGRVDEAINFIRNLIFDEDGKYRKFGSKSSRASEDFFRNVLTKEANDFGNDSAKGQALNQFIRSDLS